MRVPVKKILVPMDFSEASRHATMTANDLALAFEAELILLHVVRGIPPFPGNMGSAAAVFNTHTYQRNLTGYRSQELEAFARQIRGGERRLRTIVRERGTLEEASWSLQTRKAWTSSWSLPRGVRA